MLWILGASLASDRAGALPYGRGPATERKGSGLSPAGLKGWGCQTDRVVRAEVVALADLDLDRARQAATRVSEPVQRHWSEQGGACIFGRSQFQDPRPAGEVE